MALLAAIEDGMPLVERPFFEIGLQLRMDEAEVVARLERLRTSGIIRRFGLVVQHRPLGYRANAMVVWDVPDEDVDAAARRIAAHDFVTLCYCRERQPPQWPFNLYCMIHGRERPRVESQIKDLKDKAMLAKYPSRVLFSRRCFKQTGARFSPARIPDGVDMSAPVTLAPLDRQIINILQGGFPVVDEPYAAVASWLGIDEVELISRIDQLLQKGILSRFGPLFNSERIGGAVTLAALVVPLERFDEVANLVNAHEEVAHNYARNHKLNMWFVIATETPEAIDTVIARIEKETGLQVFNFPKEKEFFIGLRLAV